MMDDSAMDKKTIQKRNRRQAGNAIVMLFAAIGMAGVVTYGLNNVMRGPATTAAEISRRSIAENNLVATTRLAISAATHQQTASGDCDGDGFVEPVPYRESGGLGPAGGGWVPSTVGASMTDPWGLQYGYCVWDPGTATVTDDIAACGGNTARRLDGAPRDDQYAIAVISAGKNGIFETDCNAYVDADVDNIPDVPLVDKPDGSDDVVLAYTYAEANGIGGGEWKLKDGSPSTAEINKNLEIGNASNPSGASFTGALELSGTRGLILPRDPGDDSITGACNEAKDGQLRLNIGDGSAVPVLEICFEDAWTTVSGGTAVGGGTCAPDEWTDRDATAPDWVSGTAVLYEQNQFVAIGNGNDAIKTSPDGITWTRQTMPSGNWNSMAYHNGLYVAVSGGGTNYIATSTDGINWTARTAPENNTWNKVIYANGYFVAVASTGTNRVMRSADGINWTAYNVGDMELVGIAYFDGLFYASSWGGSAPHRLITSPDGAVWTPQTPTPNPSGSLATDGNILVHAGGSNIIYTTDGTNWTQISNPATGANFHRVFYTGGHFVALAYTGTDRVVISEDGMNWSISPTPINAAWHDVIQANDLWVIVGNSGEVITSECAGDGSGTESACTLGPWVDRDATSPDISVEDVEFANGTFVAVGQGNAVQTSTDGINWTQRTGAAGGEWKGVAFGAGTWVAVGYASPYIMSSTDNGVTWTARTPPENNSWQDVAYGNGYFVAVSEDGTNRVMRSADGITWTAHAAIAGDVYWSSVIFADGRFTAVRNGANGAIAGTMMTSTDGATWTAYNPATAPQGFITFGNDTYVSVQNDSYATSTDGGTTWVSGSLPAGATTIYNPVYGGGRFVASGWGGTERLITSEDGITWTTESSPVNASFLGGAFGNDTFVMAGGGSLITAECVAGSGTTDDSVALRTPHPLDAGLVGRWTMDDATGTVVSDSIGDNDGAFINTPIWSSEGAQGQSALFFNSTSAGVGDGVVINSNFEQPNKGTIALWANIEAIDSAGGGADLFNLGDTLILRHEAGTLRFSYRYGGGSYQSLPAAGRERNLLGTGWHHIIATFDDETEMFRLYVDGVAVDQFDFTEPLSYGSSNILRFGKNVANDNYDLAGGLDDVRLYDRALSPAEAAGLYERVLGQSMVRVTSLNTRNLAKTAGQISTSRMGSHSCAIRPDGSTWCWGLNTNGRLGMNMLASQLASADAPRRVVQGSLHSFTQISVGLTSTCGVTSDGTGWCWGADTNGQLGNGALAGDQPVPSPVDGGAVWSEISAGDGHACGIRQTGIAYCWGVDSSQQLGNGATGTAQVSPVLVSGGGLYSSIKAGTAHTCGIRTDGSAWCWGLGTSGELGNAASTTQNVPVAVFGNHRWKDISVGNAQTCGITTDSGLWCWGSSIGNTPRQIQSSESWVDVEVGRTHTCSTKVDGSLWCWGTDANGELGNDTAASATQTAPVRAIVSAPVSSLTAGDRRTCAMLNDNTTWCWGDDTSGSLGNGSTTGNQFLPVRVNTFPAPAPWVWNTAANAFQLNGPVTIALGPDKWISDNGTARYFGFESAGKARLRQSGSSNQLLIETGAATNSAQVSFRRGTPTTTPVDNTTNLTAEWRFNETSGTTASTSVGTFPGTLSGTTTWNPTGGRTSSNGVLEFDGMTGRVSVANNASLRPAGTFILRAWVRPDGVQDDGAIILSKSYNNGQHHSYALRIRADQRVEFVTTNASLVSHTEVSSKILRPNTWTLIEAYFYDFFGGNFVKAISLNSEGGTLGTPVTAIAYSTDSTGNLFFGSGGCTTVCNPFRGAIDDVRLYSGGYNDQVSIPMYQLNTNHITPKAIGIDHSTNNLEIGAQNSTATDWLSAITPQLSLTSAGNLGAGVTSPSMRVEASGGVRVGYEYASCSAATEGGIRFTGNTHDVAPVLSCPASSWTLRSASSAGLWSDVIYGRGLFVASAQFNGTNGIMTSPDGITWTNRTTPNQNWVALANSPTRFVAITYDSYANVITSEDGITWTPRPVPLTGWESIGYANGLFIATRVGDVGAIMTSPDGINWTARNLSVNDSWGTPTYGNGVYLIASRSGSHRIATSTDGINWTVGNAGITGAPAFGNGVFVLVNSSAAARYSYDGVNWTATTVTGLGNVTHVDFSNGQFVAVSSNSGTRHIGVSSDGINWTTYAAPQGNWWRGIAYGNGRYVAVSEDGTNRVMTSDCTTTRPGSLGMAGLPSGAVGYWAFDETSGTTAADSVGSNPGTLTGNATFGPGRRGNALVVDGASDFANMGSAASLDNLSTASICAWINGPATQAGTYQGIAGKTNAGYDGNTLYTGDYTGGSNLDLGVQSRTNSFKQKPDQIPPDTWTHICMTWDGTTATSGLKMFVNGVEQTSGFDFNDPGSGSPSDASYDFTVGGTTGAWFQGSIDEVVLYNRVLTPAEITSIMAATGEEEGDEVCSPVHSTFTQRESQRYWYGTDMSADGTVMAAIVGGGMIYVSTNSGVSWTPRDSNRDWRDIQVSADGTIMTATVNGGPVYKSTDSGLTWAALPSGNIGGYHFDMSDDGMHLAAISNSNQIYISSNGGTTWTARGTVRDYSGIKISNDGTKIVAPVMNGRIYISTDSGVNWAPTAFVDNYREVDMSDDGSVIVVAASYGQSKVSVDGGVTWSNVLFSDTFYGAAASADGSVLAISDTNGYIWVSRDTGVTWQPASHVDIWSRISMSDDGAIIISKTGHSTSPGYIYISEATQQCFTPGRFQYCDGTSWSEFAVTTPPVKWRTTSASIAGGRNNGCAITADGTTWCWGLNTNGKLGNGNSTEQLSFVQINDASNWAMISTGRSASCGVKNNGVGYCWGGSSGVLGNGSTGTSSTPVVLSGGGTWIMTKAGDEQSACGIKMDGKAYCWGVGDDGILGNGGSSDASTPQEVHTTTASPGWSDWVNIAVGPEDSCGVRANGEAYCWGKNDKYQGGNGGALVSTRPVIVGTSGTSTLFTDWVTVEPGLEFSCGLRANGTMWCWGEGSTNALGNNSTSDRTVPTQVGTAGTSTLFTDWTHLSVGPGHSCGLRSNGTAWCWGSGGYGRLGRGTTSAALVPVQVQTDTGPGGWSDWVMIKAGASNTYGVRADGSLWGWGTALNGALGNGTTTPDASRPTLLSTP